MKKILLLIFLLGLGLRFIYFPDNVYFGYDQARDSFASLEILTGHLKIIGPPSSFNDNLFHGPLIYYFYAPIYLLANHNPEFVSAFFRIFNALGIVLVFLIGSLLIHKKTGLISCLIFALSFEQSQYSLFFGHPALAVNFVLLFYLGLTILFFKKNIWGLTTSLLGLGLAIQSHYSQIILFIPLIILLIYFRKIVKFNLKLTLTALLIFLLSISSFILAEFKFNFRLLQTLINQFSNLGNISSQYGDLNHVLGIIQRQIHDNFFTNPLIILVSSLVFLFTFLFFLYQKQLRSQTVFLSTWFLAGLLPYILTNSPSYYYNPAASVSLIILFAIIYQKLAQKTVLAWLLVIPILLSNINLIVNFNATGPNSDIVIQKGMLLSPEKKALDYIYQQSSGEVFSVSALSIPLNINTTWSYLFEWYGQDKYHYLPFWTGQTASGFAGNLIAVPERSKLPSLQFLIIEPTTGIREAYQENFFREESYFTKLLDEKQFGTILVQKRQKI